MNKKNYYLNFVVAAAYFVSGQAGLLLAIPPSNAAAVWPAAGIALAAVLIYGKKVLPGILIGGILVQTVSFLDISTTEKIFSSLLIGSVISMGAMFQAWFGSRLVHNILDRDKALLKEKSILKFCLLGGPVSCVISSTIGICTLWTAGILTLVDVPLAWSTWWVGDSIGVFVFCPIILCLLGKPYETWRQRIASVALPLCVLTLMIFVVFRFSYQHEMKNIEDEFEKNTELFTNEIRTIIDDHIELNTDLKELFDSSESVSTDTFSNFTRPKLSRYSGMKALEWIPKILHADRNRYEIEMGFPITAPDSNGDMQRAPIKEYYFPITYLEPYKGNEKALGYDIYSNPLALSASESACLSGEMAVTEAIKIVQEKISKTGFVFYSPVYKNGFDSNNTMQLCQNLAGYVATVLVLDKEINSILKKLPDLKLSFSLKDNGQVFYSKIEEANHSIPNQFRFERIYALPVANSEWELVFSPSIGFISLYSSRTIWLIIVVGLFFVGVTGIGLLVLTGRTLLTEETIKLKTIELNDEIKERKLAEKILSLEKKYLEMIAEKFTLHEILEKVSQGVEEIIPDTSCSFLLLDSTGRYLNHGAAPSLPEEYTDAINGVEIGPNVGSCGTAAYFNEQVIVKNIEEDPLWKDYRDFALKHGLKACWSTPVTTEGDKVLGTFALYFYEVKEPEANHIEYINRFANIAAIAILRRQTEKMLTYQVSHDSLTGLINRHEFEHRAEQLLSTIEQDNDEHALCFLDLDQFKVVNDTCGHIAGDELLRQLGQILQGIVRQRDTLARIGGDEFAILMEYCSLMHAQRVAKSIQDAIQDFQFAWEGRSFKVGVSIGLVSITNQITSLSELLKQADTACYMAKDLGRNRIHIYHPDDQDIAQRHGEMQWVTRLYKALEENRFELFAQNIVPLDNSQDIHHELLIRMKDEEGKFIPPGAFLPAAERYNLMMKLDSWVVKNAFQDIASHPSFLEKINFFSINLSGQSLATPEFLEFVILQLDKNDIDGEKVCFEITETAAISNVRSAIKFISTLKNLGCKFALDDFGSGLSSFGYLKNLPVNYLKIDGMFVKDIVDDPIDHAMVRSINEIGQVMGMKTIAEFVENDEIKGMLREIGVNYAQGYGIGKPLPLNHLLQDKKVTPFPVNF